MLTVGDPFRLRSCLLILIGVGGGLWGGVEMVEGSCEPMLKAQGDAEIQKTKRGKMRLRR